MTHCVRDVYIALRSFKTGQSLVWSYFGQLTSLKTKQAIDNNTIYCKICFDKQLTEHPDDPLLSLAYEELRCRRRKQLSWWALHAAATGTLKLFFRRRR